MPGDSKQTTQATSEPWKPAQPALKYGVDKALQYAKKGIGGDVFTGSTVIPWDQQTKRGMNSIQSGANANLAGNGLSGQYQDVINQGGYTDDQRQSADVMSGVMGGSGLTGDQEAALQSFRSGMNNGLTGDQQFALWSAKGMLGGNGLSSAQQAALGGLQGLASNPFNSYQQSALQNTQKTANSNFDVNSNPAFQDVLRQAQGAARESVNMSAGGAGRYGGGVHQGNLASEVGDLTSRMVGGEYQNWQNRRDAANSNLFNMGQTGIGTQMSANQGAAGIGQQGIGNLQNAQSSVFNMGQTDLSNRNDAASNAFNMGQTGQTNRSNAANSLYGMGQQALGNLGSAYTGMQQPANDLMKIGGMNEDLATRKMNDKLRIFNEKQNKPWDQLGRLNAIASGAGQMGGTQTQTQPGQNPFLSALGYGATGAGLLGSFF